MSAAPLDLADGFHAGIPMARYLELDMMHASRLEWLAKSPLEYRYRLDHGSRPATPALELGSALHTAVLEPELFDLQYIPEPEDLRAIAPHADKPRATKAYKEWVTEHEARGARVLRPDQLQRIRAMAGAIHAHPHARAALEASPRRELTMVWSREGRRCCARADGLGDVRMLNLKTTRDLRNFSPWHVTRYGYYRSATWYLDGAEQLDGVRRDFDFVAVESSPPYDVGVFELDLAAAQVGAAEVDRLMQLLARCEREGRWPGMYPDPAIATIASNVLEGSLDLDGAEEVA